MLDSEDLISSIVQVQVLLLLVLLSGLFLINRNLSQRIWRPFYTTLDKLRGYKVEQHQALNLAGSNINEFNDLNGSLEELTGRMHRSFLVQKEFTENAAHEMQTPLAIFQSKLELLMQTSPINEEQAGLIGDLADAGRRMGRLNKALILLTRIENQQFADIESVALKSILQKQVVQFNSQAEQKHIVFSLRVPGRALHTGQQGIGRNLDRQPPQQCPSAQPGGWAGTGLAGQQKAHYPKYRQWPSAIEYSTDLPSIL